MAANDVWNSRSRAPLTPEGLSSMAPSKIFKEQQSGKGETNITAITFEDDGKRCVTCGEDGMFTYWDVLNGRRHSPFASHKYGVDLVTATHALGEIIHASTKINHAIRHHTSSHNKYLNYFDGHEGKVISLSMHPISPTFLSGSEDQTVRMWDIRAGGSVKGLLKDLQGPAITAWEPTGMVFAVGLPNETAVCLYAYGTFDRKPFKWTKIKDPVLLAEATPPRIPIITSLAFSNDGKLILVGTSGDVHWVLDAMDLFLVARLQGHKGLERGAEGEDRVMPRKGDSGQEVRWTPDSQFVMSGSQDGQICIWDLRPPTGHASWPDPNSFSPKEPIPTIAPMRILNDAKLGGQSRVVMFSPRYNMFVSGGKEVVMWLPSRGGGKDKNADEDEDMDRVA